MPAVIVIENPYSNENAIERLVYYIVNQLKAPDYSVYGNHINLMNADTIINSFKLIQSIYQKTDRRKIRHIIVSFNNNEGIIEEDVSILQYAAVEYFRKLGQQVLTAIHLPFNNEGKIHFHMAVNTVNLYTGLKYSGTYTQSTDFFNYMKSIEPYHYLHWILEPKYSTEYAEVN
ncbi:relaxase/mobilization nuclease domain-containing protein [Lacrimispora sp.]|uniref:relaxase/mobilization nuclease domain-containing protein n=1 Tax=Lacrimispora sp. TaxID=2719234 RepID=UPI00345F327C